MVPATAPMSVIGCGENSAEKQRNMTTRRDTTTTSHDIALSSCRTWDNRVFNTLCIARPRFIGTDHPLCLSHSITALFRSLALRPSGIPLGQSCSMALAIPRVLAPGPDFAWGAAHAGSSRSLSLSASSPSIHVFDGLACLPTL